MLAAHTAAAAVTFLLLRWGERSFLFGPTSSARALLRILFPSELQPVPLDAFRSPGRPLTAPEPLSPKRPYCPRSRYRGPPTFTALTFA